MKVFLITYDLHSPGKDYNNLHEGIRSLGNWWHYLDSTWLIANPLENANSIARKLKTHMDQNDYILVVEITRQPREGWLPQEAWDWINNQENLPY